jgi:hypothetical protein
MGQNMWGYRCALAIAASFALAAPLCAENVASSDAAGLKTESKSRTRAESERRIEAALDLPLRAPLEFIETPLNQIANVLSEDYDIPIVFDVTALDAVASSPEVEASIQIGNVSLRSALDLMLRNAGEGDLTYIIDNEVLLITTQEEAEKRLEVRVYRVDDLVRFKLPYSDEDEVDFDSLIDLIVATIEHESWMENGTGEGDIQPFPAGIIVVSQTRRVHDKINELLERLRAAKKSIDEDSTAAHEDRISKPLTRVYAFNDAEMAKCEKSREAIRDAIEKSVDWNREVEGMNSDQLFLHVLPNRVLVRHVPEVVGQVGRIVRDLAPAHPKGASGCSGALGGAGGASSADSPSNAPDLADPPAAGEDGEQPQQRSAHGGEGVF